MKVKIISVETVSGRTLNKNWKSDMQVIETDNGEYIDNIPYGGYQEGHDWEDEIGNSVEVSINNSRGYEWINFIKKYPKTKLKNQLKAKMKTMTVVIKHVETVRGKTLNNRWKSDMQVIQTNKGKFIDNIPFGGYEEGHDWKNEVGKSVVISINNSRGYEWINFIKRSPKSKTKKIRKSEPKMETMNVTIKDVKIVNGKTLNRNWKSDMQVVTTNAGEFIDNIPYGGYEEGHNWRKEVGHRVKIQPNHNKGHLWINFIERIEHKVYKGNSIQPHITNPYEVKPKILYPDEPKYVPTPKTSKKVEKPENKNWKKYIWIGIIILIILIVNH